VNTTPGAPAALAVNAELIPAALKSLNLWVTWAYTQERDPETGEIDWDKPPRNARTGGLASSTNPKTWSPYDQALAAYQRGGLDGIGFVLDGSGDLVAVDLDKCRDPQTGAVKPWAQEIVQVLLTYTEVSPSGRGLRLFLRGKLPPHARKKGAYENYSSGRYVTVTGAHLDGTPRTIEGREVELLAVHRKVFGEPQPPARERNGHAPAPDLDDAEVVRRASEAKQGSKFRALWEGSAHGFASNSEADLALVNYLAFWCGPDPDRIDALFRQSGLFRSKWNRQDYRERTIRKALAGRTEFYEPRNGKGARAAPGGRSGKAGANGAGRAAGTAPAPPGPGQAAMVQDPVHLTDRGNAIRLVCLHGEDLRHCHPWRKWLTWDGRRWQADATAAATRAAKDVAVSLWREATLEIDRLTPQAEEAPT
jgi:primase-polymerase (primpol)-like protein